MSDEHEHQPVLIVPVDPFSRYITRHLLCETITLGEPGPKDAIVGTCGFCPRPVWVTRGHLALIVELEYYRLEYMVICHYCNRVACRDLKVRYIRSWDEAARLAALRPGNISHFESCPDALFIIIG